MLRRHFLAAAAAPLFAQQRTRPNVLLVVADDLNTALGCYGHPVVKTPNIDALARQGVRFERAYCQVPLCCPSRASFLTGMRPDTTGIWANDEDIRVRHPNVETLPQLFKNNGWFSAREGKMFHMNVPMGVGTPMYQDAPSWNHNGSPQGLEDKSPGELHQLTPKTPRGAAIDWMSVAQAKGQADEDAASHAIALLEEHRKDPFFLGLGFVRPHVPLVAPAKFFDMYPLSACNPVKNPPGDDEDLSPMFRRIRPDLWNNMDMDEAKQREALRAYYASTSFMDDQLGRVVSALDAMKMRDNTIIVFTSDHGWHLGEHFRWQKRSLLEESARVPLIVCDPRRNRGPKTSSALVELVDLYPTLAELAGLNAPSNIEGQSFVPLLKSPGRRWKRAAFTQFQTPDTKGIGIRTPSYHYMEWKSPAGKIEEELYDSRKDPREFRNVATDPAYAKQREQAKVLLAGGWKGARA